MGLVRAGARSRSDWDAFCGAIAKREGWELQATLDALSAARDAFQWHARARVYDSLMQRRAVELSLEGLNDMRERFLDMSHNIAGLARQELAKLQARSEENGDLPVLDPKSLIKFIEVAQKTELLIRGQATDRVETKSNLDLTKLSDDELEQLRELQAKVESK